jgi:hypothetical protein
MVVGYSYLGWKDEPVKVICMAIAVGLGALKKSDLQVLVRRAFGIPDDHHSTPNHKNNSSDDNPGKT